MTQSLSKSPQGCNDDRPQCSDATALAWLANIGELAGPLAHEVNNFLNTLMLHLAVLEMKVPEGLRADLGAIRRQGNALAALVRYLQQYRQHLQRDTRSTKILDVFQEAVEGLIAHPPSALEGVPLRYHTAAVAEPSAVPGIDIVLSTSAEVPPVEICRPDAVRLVLYLLRQAALAVSAAGGGMVFVSAQASDSHVVIQIRDTGAPVNPEVLAQCFDAATTIRPGVLGLELAACRSIARRFHGSIEVSPGEPEGMLVTVRLPVSTSR